MAQPEPRDSARQMSDGDKLVAWLREAADELENAHALLDAYKTPRKLPAGLGGDGTTECTLAARISLALHGEAES